jgi:hypothetical protein
LLYRCIHVTARHTLNVSGTSGETLQRSFTRGTSQGKISEAFGSPRRSRTWQTREAGCDAARLPSSAFARFGPMSLRKTDQEAQAVATAPRVALADIEAEIQTVHWINGTAVLGKNEPVEEGEREALSLLTICVVLIRNGFTIVGKSAPASPENFNQELGEKFAYEDAIRQLWPLLGFALREKLFQAS